MRSTALQLPRKILVSIGVAVCLTVTALGQTKTRATPSEAEVLAQGWNTLARGDVAQAGAVADRLQRLPGTERSAAALAFIVEVRLRAGGPTAALDGYESWLGSRTLENPYALRPIALAILRSAASGAAGRSRAEARHALAADGDEGMEAAIAAEIKSGEVTAVLVGAASGNRAAIDRLVADLAGNPDVRVPIIEALGDSRDPAAARALIPLLTSDRDEILAATARALGHAGQADAIAPLQPLLNDPRFHVRFAAAEALVRLGDSSGTGLLQEALSSPQAPIRAAAAEALAARPPANWSATVEALLRDPDPQVRATAARALAVQDPEAAAKTLAELMEDPNPAIRQLAGLVAAESAPSQPTTSDVRGWRKLLRSPESLVRVRAAAEIARLTR